MNAVRLLLVALVWTVALGAFAGAGVAALAVGAIVRSDEPSQDEPARDGVDRWAVVAVGLVFFALFLALLGGSLL